MIAYVNRIVLVKFGYLLNLAHHHDQGLGAVEQAIFGA